MDELDKLQEVIEKTLALLKDRHCGLSKWVNAYCARINELKEIIND
jgi:hypothetical protein